MYHKSSKRKEHVRQVAVYILMACTVFVVVTFVTLFMLGFRFDADKGSVEQYAFLQFASSPSGATVSIDGKVNGSKTPNKSPVQPGKHEIVMWREGYETWEKSVDVRAGTLTWLNYALLVPKKLTVEPVAQYDSVYSSLASPKGDSLVIERKSDTPEFDLIDISSDKIKSTVVSVPKTVYSDADISGVMHVFRAEKWDSGGRYILVSHQYGDKSEWLALDTQDPAASKNISRTFDISVSSIVFSGSSGNMFYALITNDIRRLDLAAGTISKPIASNVSSFELYEKSKVITYVGSGKPGTNERVVGVYREGDDESFVVRTAVSDPSVPFHVSTVNYFNENYLAISEGKMVDILSGSYPNTTSDNANSMKIISSFQTKYDILSLGFSPAGEYLLTQNGADYTSYDLEYRKLDTSAVAGSGPTVGLKWLNDNHLLSDRDGKLVVREFDGANGHTINSVVSGQDVTLTNNGRFMYSVGQSKTGYQLQRVRMILP